MIGFKRDFNEEFHKIQKRMLVHTEKLAAINGTKLNYTSNSISVLDEMFVKIAKEFEEAGLHEGEIETNESAQGIAEATGCYIVECIERQYGQGYWAQTKDGHSFKTSSGTLIYPMTWAMKKLLDPSGYSLTRTYNKWTQQ